MYRLKPELSADLGLDGDLDDDLALYAIFDTENPKQIFAYGSSGIVRDVETCQWTSSQSTAL